MQRIMGNVGRDATVVLCLWLVTMEGGCEAVLPEAEALLSSDGLGPSAGVSAETIRDGAAMMWPSDGLTHDKSHLRRFQRKLLVKNDESPTPESNTTVSHSSGEMSNWPFLVGVLVTVLSISLFTMVVMKFQLCRRLRATYRHVLLEERDDASRCDSRCLEADFPNRVEQRYEDDDEEEEDDDDNDGFIEDNYIQASDKERADGDIENSLPAQEDSDDELII